MLRATLLAFIALVLGFEFAAEARSDILYVSYPSASEGACNALRWRSGSDTSNNAYPHPK